MKLAKLLAEPGSLPVGELLERAQRQAEKSRLGFEVQLLQLIAQLEVSLTRAEGSSGSDWVDEVSALAAGGIGSSAATGIRGVDQVFQSLCDLMARCKTADKADAQGLGAHLKVLSDLVRNKYTSQSVVDQLLRRLDPRGPAPHTLEV